MPAARRRPLPAHGVPSYSSVRFDQSAACPMSGHSRSASPREKGFVSSPRYRLPTSVVPCTIVGASAAARLRSLHRPAMNRVSTELRYRPSTVAPGGVDENQVTFTGRYRLSVVENPPVSGPAAPTFVHLAMPPSAESLPWVRGPWISAGWVRLAVWRCWAGPRRRRSHGPERG